MFGQGLAGPQVLASPAPRSKGSARTAVDLDEFAEGRRLPKPFPPGARPPRPAPVRRPQSRRRPQRPGPLWIFRAGPKFDRTWPDKAYALDDASHVLRLDAERPSPDTLARWIDTGE